MLRGFDSRRLHFPRQRAFSRSVLAGRDDAEHGLDDAVVAGAAAEIARQADADLFLGRVRVLREESRRRDQHPRGAESALDAAVLEEDPLQGREAAVVGKALHGGDGAAFRLQGQVGAGVYRPAVEQHHAGAALRVVASLLGAGEADVLADGAKERGARLHLERVRDAVDAQGEWDSHPAACRERLAGTGTETPRARATAASIARRASTAAIARRYCSDARTSEIGSLASAAACAASSAAARPPSEPTSASSAAGTSLTVGARAVIASLAALTRSPASVTTAVAPTTAISICCLYSRRA